MSGDAPHHVIRWNVEFLDIEDGEMLSAFEALVRKRGYGNLYDRLPREEPPRGGGHLGWLCTEVAGNTKLAMREVGIRADGHPDIKTLIETRGEGGLLVVAPTPAGIHPDVPDRGYIMVRGSWAEMPVITPEARKALLECAMALNKYIELPPLSDIDRPHHDPPEGSPGEDFNRRATQAEMRATLQRHSWVVDHSQKGTDFLRRPGKSEGYSATLGHVAPNILYVFSSNASPFQGPHGDHPGTSYKPFAVYTLLECDGDFQKAARMLALSGYGASTNGHMGAPPQDTDEPEVTEEPPEEEIPIHLTDRGNALRLVKAHGNDLHYIYRWKKWLVWDRTRWVVDEGNLVERLAKDVITQLYLSAQRSIQRVSDALSSDGEPINEESRKRREQQVNHATATLKWALKSESAERLSGMLKHARSERSIAITPEQLDANPWILNCLNGTIDLKTGDLYPHCRADLCTKRLHIPYDKQAQCPHWREQFLWRIMGGPKADAQGHEGTLTEQAQRAERLIGYLQRSVGYSLTGVIREQVLQFMHGTGDNGKSTFSEVLAAMLGDYYQKAPQELLMRKAHHQSNGPSPELARLCGVRLVIAQEIDEKHRLNEAQVKDLTGNDTLTARGLYEDYFEFKPTHKIWMYGNHKPVIVGTDDAIWKRPKLIPFTQKIPKDEQVTDLREKHLIPELPGILTWAVNGCLEWQKNGLQVPSEVEIETTKYRNEMDLVSGFIAERCDEGTTHDTLGSELHGAYLQYLDGDKESLLSARKFYGRLRDRGFDSYVGTANKTHVIGLKLKPATVPGKHSAPQS